MKFDLGLHYENLGYDDPKRSYSTLLNIIERTIMRKREQSNLAQTQVGLRQMLERKDLLAAPAKPHDKDKKNPMTLLRCYLKAKPRLMQRPRPKAKAKPKKATRSESTDSKGGKARNISAASFISLIQGCRNGDKCPFSHSKKTPERTPTPGRSRTRSPSGGGSNRPCSRVRTVHSKTRQQPRRQPRRMPIPNLKRMQSQRLNQVHRRRRRRSRRPNQQLRQFECAGLGTHWLLPFRRGPRTLLTTSQLTVTLIPIAGLMTKRLARCCRPVLARAEVLLSRKT